MVRQLELPAEISRVAPPPRLYPFTRFFRGFERVPAVRELFGEETAAVLGSLKVEFVSSRFIYMAVSHKDAHLIVSSWHLRNSEFRTLYLDFVHELYHVWQFMHAKESFIKGYERLVRKPTAYFKNPIEAAAYRHTVAEAETIGMTEDEIAEYLKVPWSTPNAARAFLEQTVRKGAVKTGSTRLPSFVSISRDVPIALSPFNDYFKGFENVPGVRALFGKNAENVLAGLKVEHTSYPLGYVGMDFEDGHFLVNSWHLVYSELTVFYLDIFFCLQTLSQFLEGRYELAGLFIDGSIMREPPAFREYAARLVGYDSFESFAAAAANLKDYGFIDTPIGLEAYKATLDEGRRIGMIETELEEYFFLPDSGMTRSAHRRLLRNLGLGRQGRNSPRKR